MGTPPLADDLCIEAVRAVSLHRSKQDAAASLGIPRSTLRSRIRKAEERGIYADEPSFSVDPLTSEDVPTPDLLARKDRDWERKKQARSDRNLIHIKLNVDGPFGLMFFGDPHIDDDGCNWKLFREHTELIKENRDILFSVLAGDLTNNWIGRLNYKYGQQTITAKQSWQLVEWWLTELGESIMLGVMGNHDHWARGVQGSSPLEWFMANRTGVLEPYEVNASINTPSGESFTVNLRHNFKGSSIYNKALAGMVKQLRIKGWWPDIMLAGHIHISQFTQVLNPTTKRVTHLVRASGYKEIDDYADREEFADHSIFESAVLVCDPYEKDPRYRVRVYDPIHGVKVLKMMRSEWECDKSAGTFIL